MRATLDTQLFAKPNMLPNILLQASQYGLCRHFPNLSLSLF